MNTLVVDLQEGFGDDLVVIEVDDRQVFRKAGVRTRMQIGLAESIELKVASGHHSLRVSLPEKGLQEEISIDPGATPYLGVSLEPGRLRLAPSAEPHRYA